MAHVKKGIIISLIGNPTTVRIYLS